MIPARHLVTVVAVGLAAALAGFGATAWFAGGNETFPAVAAVPVAPPEEAVRPHPPEPPSSTIDHQPAPPASPPETAPADPEPPPVVEPREPPAPARPRPRVEPETPVPTPAPAPTPAPPPEPAPDLDPRDPAATVPTPPPPPAVATEPAPDPPAGIRIPAGSLATGYEPARRELVAALGRAAPGSTTTSDIRRMLSLWKAYLGPEASDVPEGRRATIARALRDNAWWYSRRDAPVGRVLLADPDGVILTYRPGQGFAVNPVATTGRWQGLNAEVEPAGLAEALLPMGVVRRAGDRWFTVWEYYDVPGDLTATRPGPSGMAQARVALVMAYAAERTGEARFADAATSALAALTVDVDGGGVRSMVTTAAAQAQAPWFVERAYPGEDPWTGGALNGFMVTLLNLRGASAVLDRAAAATPDAAEAAALARDLADRGAVTLERHLPDHDTGSWSLYGLLTPGRAWKSYLADLNYHCYHVRLLRQLAGPYPDASFAGVADRWADYVEDAGTTCPARPSD